MDRHHLHRIGVGRCGFGDVVLALGDELEVLEQRLQRWDFILGRKRHERLDEIDEAQQVLQPHGIDRLPKAGVEDHGFDEIDRPDPCRCGPQPVAFDDERLQSGPCLGREVSDLLDVIDGADEVDPAPTRAGSHGRPLAEPRSEPLGRFAPDRGRPARVPGESGQVAHADPVPGPLKDAQYRDAGVLGTKDLQPGNDIDHLGPREQSTEPDHFGRNALRAERVGNRRHQLSLAAEHGDLPERWADRRASCGDVVGLALPIGRDESLDRRQGRVGSGAQFLRTGLRHFGLHRVRQLHDLIA